jgi:mannose/fructose/N-acetylgalactosamine-specific phosphotransferase system component IIC
MALIQCHECSGKVSDHARTCPHCGASVIASIKRKQKAALVGLAIRLATAVIIGITLWFTLNHIFNKALAPLKAMQQQQQPH